MAFDDLQQILPERRRSSLVNRKLLLVLACVVAILCVVIIGLCAALAHTVISSGRSTPSRNESDSGPESSASQQSQGSSDGKCPTLATDHFSLRSLQAINPDVDYCSNFYQYACGGWIKDKHIPPDKGEVSTWSQLFDENEERLRELLEEPVRRNTPESIERKVKQLYKMCLHDYGRSRQGGAPLVDLIKKELGGWYGFDPNHWQNTWNMETAFSKLQGDYLVDVFLKVSIGISPIDHKSRIITARSGGLGMRYYYYRDKYYQYYADIQDAYKDYMRETASLLLRDANQTLAPTEIASRVEQFVSDVYGHEKRMAEGMSNLHRSQGYWKGMHMTIEELSNNYTQVDWKPLFEGMFQEVASAGYMANIITPDTQVFIRPKGYFDFLESVFLNETSDRDRIFNNYMVWRLLDTYSSDLSWEYMYARLRFQERRSGRSEFIPSWKWCVDMIRQRLPQAMGALIIEKHIPLEAKKQIKSMVENIQKTYIDRFEELAWMDKITKDRAKLKMESTRDYLILPDKWFNNSFVDGLHHLLEIKESDGYFKSLLSTTHYVRIFRILELMHGISYEIWMYGNEREGMGIHPRYFSDYHALLVPLGSAHIPMFSDDAFKFFNYGALGTATAYELADAVNEIGRYEWTNGSFVDWWTTDSASNYMKAENCFGNYFTGIQLGPYMIDGEEKMVALDGRRDSWRAVSEQSAMRAGYRAYLKWSKGNKNEAGLGKLTAKQTFFLTSAQTQCGKMRDTLAYKWAQYDHIPSEQMVNGVLSNMPEFAAAFNCASDSKMFVPNVNVCEVF